MGAATRRACGPWGRRLCLLSCGHPGPSGHPSLPRLCSPRRSRCRQAVLSYSPVPDRSPAARLQSWEPQTCSFSPDLPLALFQSRTWFHSGPLYHGTLTHRTFPARDPVLQHPLGPLSTPTSRTCLSSSPDPEPQGPSILGPRLTGPLQPKSSGPLQIAPPYFPYQASGPGFPVRPCNSGTPVVMVF